MFLLFARAGRRLEASFLRFERDARMPIDTGESAWNSDVTRKVVVEGHDEVGN